MIVDYFASKNRLRSSGCGNYVLYLTVTPVVLFQMIDGYARSAEMAEGVGLLIKKNDNLTPKRPQHSLFSLPQ